MKHAWNKHAQNIPLTLSTHDYHFDHATWDPFLHKLEQRRQIFDFSGDVFFFRCYTFGRYFEKFRSDVGLTVVETWIRVVSADMADWRA